MAISLKHVSPWVDRRCARARPPSRLTLLADRCAHTGPRSVPSWPVNGDRPLTTPEGTLPLEEAVYKGFKLFHGAAAEARSLAGIMIYLAWFADPVAMAHLLGIEEPDPYEALMYVLDAVKEGTKVMIVGAAPCCLHLAGVPGFQLFPQLIARMQPTTCAGEEAQCRPSLLGHHWGTADFTWLALAKF